MSYFKKFTDFCAGLAAFVASLFLLREYMVFEPLSPEDWIENAGSGSIDDAPDKLKQFLDQMTPKDYSMLVALVLLLAVSLLAGRIFKRLPSLCFAVSIMPLMQAVYAFERDKLYEQEVLFLVLCSLHVLGNAAEALLRDREDGRHRMWLLAKLSSLGSATFCFVVWRMLYRPTPESREGLNPLELEIFFGARDPDGEIVTKLLIMFLLLLAVSVLLYNVYFIDAIISVVPLAYSVHALYSDNLSIAPVIFFTLSAVCAVTHLLLAVFENNLSRREQGFSKKERAK